MGYLLGRGIPVIVGLVDRICNDILKNMWGGYGLYSRNYSSGS
jgi:hypothetical protein